MWDVDSGKELYRFTGHNGSVHQLSLSSDAKRLVTSSADGSAKVWDLATVVRKLDGIDHPTPSLHPRCTVDVVAGGKTGFALSLFICACFAEVVVGTKLWFIL